MVYFELRALFWIRISFRYTAICKPLLYQRKKMNKIPQVDIAASFLLGIALQVPRVFSYEFNGDAITLKETFRDNIMWEVYLIFSEILVRLGPTILLIGLNIAIIRQFNLSIRRKKRLRARRFVQRTSSKLLRRSSGFFHSAKLDLPTNQSKRLQRNTSDYFPEIFNKEKKMSRCVIGIQNVCRYLFSNVKKFFLLFCQQKTWTFSSLRYEATKEESVEGISM